MPLGSWKRTQEPVNKHCCPMVSPNRQSKGQFKTEQPDVRTTANYTREVDQLTKLYFYETKKAKGIYEPGDSAVEISISDSWPRAKKLYAGQERIRIAQLRSNTQ